MEERNTSMTCAPICLFPSIKAVLTALFLKEL